MRDIPQQSSDMAAADRAELAVLGHRIEVWNSAKQSAGSL